jgi:DNA gyrase subunit A
MEESFTINAVTLVDGQPQTLGLITLLNVFIDHRIEVVTRRSAFRKRLAQERLHVLEGLLIAILDIDEVIQIIRESEDTSEARNRLTDIFDLTEIQANYILEMPLRRLTKFSRIEIAKEADDLRTTIEELESILTSDSKLREMVSNELGEIAAQHATARRTLLLEATGIPRPKSSSVSMEVPDESCIVLLSSTGLIARTSAATTSVDSGDRQPHDVIISVTGAMTRGEIGVVTSTGNIHRIPVVDIPAIPPTVGIPGLSGGAPLGAFVELSKGESAVAIAPLESELLLMTKYGQVKRVASGHAISRPTWDVIRLEPGDSVVNAYAATANTFDRQQIVLITDQAQLLHFPLKSLRAQGRSASGVAGIKLVNSHVLFGGVVNTADQLVVATVSGSSQALPGTELGNAKVTNFDLYPAKGRATAGVRCHKFRSGEDSLINAWVGVAPPRGSTSSGIPVELPDPDSRRDGTGTPLNIPIDAISGNITFHEE